MGAVKCVWYVSGFRRPWEAAVIGNLAAVVGGYALQVYAEGGTADFHFNGVLPWKSLTLFERVKIVLFEGRLWHLWGDAPCWWGLVRLRARTIHTSLKSEPNWKGHPTRLFAEQARDGESRIKPTFDLKVAWAGGSDDSGLTPTLLLAARPEDSLRKALLEAGIETVSMEAAETELSLKRGVAVFVDNSPSNALLAAYLTIRGVPVLAAGASLLKAILGPGGCISPSDIDGKPDPKGAVISQSAWKEALGRVLSDAGRTASASARHFLKENYSPSDSAESLERLYRTTTS